MRYRKTIFRNEAGRPLPPVYLHGLRPGRRSRGRRTTLWSLAMVAVFAVLVWGWVLTAA